MDQQLFNMVIAIAGALGGWWMKAMWEGLKDLQKADRDLTSEVAQLQTLVAGQYMRREEFERTSQAIFAKLDRIEDKLDGKADK
jgi:hypothetical protein